MIGEKLKTLRIQKGYTIVQMCELTGLNQNTYAKYERNERDVSTELLNKLADFYGVTTDYLLGRTPPPDPFADLGISADDEKAALEKFLSLPDEVRAAILNAMREMVGAMNNNPEP